MLCQDENYAENNYVGFHMPWQSCSAPSPCVHGTCCQVDLRAEPTGWGVVTDNCKKSVCPVTHRMPGWEGPQGSPDPAFEKGAVSWISPARFSAVMLLGMV